MLDEEQAMVRTYSTIWRGKGLADDAETIDEVIAALEAAIADLRAMRDAGIQLAGPIQDDYAYLVTTDPDVAEAYGLQEDEDFEDDEDLGDEDFEVGPSGNNGYHPE